QHLVEHLAGPLLVGGGHLLRVLRRRHLPGGRRARRRVRVALRRRRPRGQPHRAHLDHEPLAERPGDEQVADPQQRRSGGEEQHAVQQGEPRAQAQPVPQRHPARRRPPAGGPPPEPPPVPGALPPHPPEQAEGGHSRYPRPGTFSISGGGPSLRRSEVTVTRSTPLPGSANSSQTRLRSSAAGTRSPCARISSCSRSNSLRVSVISRPSRVTGRRAGSSRTPHRSSTAGTPRGARRPRVRTRATSSANANGFTRETTAPRPTPATRARPRPAA